MILGSPMATVLALYACVLVVGMVRPGWLWIGLVCTSFWYPTILALSVTAAKQVVGLPISVYDVAAATLVLSALLRSWHSRTPPFRPGKLLFFAYCGTWFALIGVLRVIAFGGDPAALTRASLWMVVASLDGRIRFNGHMEHSTSTLLVVATLAALIDLVRREAQQGFLHGGYAIGNLVFQKAELSMNSFAFLLVFCVVLYWVFDTGWTVSRTVLLVGSFLGVAVSLSRSNFLALIVVVLWLTIRSWGQSRLRLGLGREAQLDPSTEYRLLELTRIPTESLRGVSYSLLGHGAGAWIPSDLSAHLGVGAFWAVHSEWLLVLYDFGLVGVLLYAGLYWALWPSRGARHGAMGIMTVAWVCVSVTAGQLLTVSSWMWVAWLLSRGCDTCRNSARLSSKRTTRIGDHIVASEPIPAKALALAWREP
jgi:hypothetical protein